MVKHLLMNSRFLKAVAGISLSLPLTLAPLSAQQVDVLTEDGGRQQPSRVQSPALQDAKPQAPDAPQVQAAPGPRAAPVPDNFRLNMMIRSMVLALNHANLTGNYTVLRELGAPGFQVANNPARLAEIFAPMRARKLDLTPILFFNPRLSNEPAVQDGQVLRLTGFFATQPEQVNFDLAFQVFAGQWMLAGISVSTSPAQQQRGNAQTSALPSPPSAAPAKPPSPATSEDGAAPNADAPKPVRIDLSEPAPLPARRPRTSPPPRSASAAQPAPPATPARPAQDAPSGWRPQ